jgi:hypothetical protein
MKHTPKLVLLALCGLLLTACATNKKAVYANDSFDIDSPFMKKVEVPVATGCESARRALLGQGYLIDSASSDKVKGRKSYKNQDSRSTFIEMNVVCVPDTSGSTLYANGVLSTYDLKKSGTSASVGVKAVGSISLPFGQSADSMVKIAEETIDDKKFYSRFFAVVDHILADMQPSAEPAETFPATATPVPEPAPVETVPVTEPAPASAPAATTAPASAPVSTPASAVTAAPVPAPAPSPAAAAPAAPEQEPAPAPAVTTAPVAAPVSTPAPADTTAPVPAPAPAPAVTSAPISAAPASTATAAPAPAQEPAPTPPATAPLY